jgi:hypothetical protein
MVLCPLPSLLKIALSAPNDHTGKEGCRARKKWAITINMQKIVKQEQIKHLTWNNRISILYKRL